MEHERVFDGRKVLDLASCRSAAHWMMIAVASVSGKQVGAFGRQSARCYSSVLDAGAVLTQCIVWYERVTSATTLARTERLLDPGGVALVIVHALQRKRLNDAGENAVTLVSPSGH